MTAASDPNSDAEGFHIPGIRTTVRQFIECVYLLAGEGAPRVFSASTRVLKLAGLFSNTLSAVADISHLWTDPILLDGSKYAARFGAVPQTPMELAINETISWHRSHWAVLQLS